MTMSNDTAAQPNKLTHKIHLLPFAAAVAISLGVVLSTFIAAGTWKEVRKRPDKKCVQRLSCNPGDHREFSQRRAHRESLA